MIPVKIHIEHAAEESVLLRCPNENAPHIRALLAFLSDAQRHIPGRNDEEEVFLAPSEVLYCEYVERGVFLYTQSSIYKTPLSLSQIEALSPTFMRCAKATVVRIGAISRLRSLPGGRILATLENGERILISRHYAAALRARLNQ